MDEFFNTPTQPEQPQPEQPPYQQPYPPQQPYAAAYSPYTAPYQPQQPENPGKGWAIASLVLGIVSVVCCCVWYVALVPALLAVIFGIVGVAKKQGGMAVAGLILGCIGLAFCILMIVFTAIGINTYSVERYFDSGELPDWNEFFGEAFDTALRF